MTLAGTSAKSPSIVSIHTPTKGVTCDNLDKLLHTLCFNPHTHEGCDAVLVAFILKRLKRFNPHTHEGCDRRNDRSRCRHLRFNPHTHEGCDWALRVDYQLFISFNPHTHEGCDIPHRHLYLLTVVSIHTPTKGVTQQTLILKPA